MYLKKEEERESFFFNNNIKIQKEDFIEILEEKISKELENEKLSNDEIDNSSSNKSNTIQLTFVEPKTYQIVLFLITQLGYSVITGSMLSIAYFEPSKVMTYFKYI